MLNNRTRNTSPNKILQRVDVEYKSIMTASGASQSIVTSASDVGRSLEDNMTTMRIFGHESLASHKIITQENVTHSHVHPAAIYFVVRTENPDLWRVAVPQAYVTIHIDDIAHIDRC